MVLVCCKKRDIHGQLCVKNSSFKHSHENIYEGTVVDLVNIVFVVILDGT